MKIQLKMSESKSGTAARSDIWDNFGRWDKVVTISPNKSTKKRRLSGASSRQPVTRTVSDPGYRKCKHCGQRVHRKLPYAVDHLNICQEYKGNKFDEKGNEIIGGEPKKDSKSSNKTKSKSENKSNDTQSDSDSSDDSDSDAYGPQRPKAQTSISDFTVKQLSKGDQEMMNQWLANGIATAGSISYNAIATNPWFKQIFDRIGFKIQSWDAIKKKIYKYENELKLKTDKYLRDNVETATIGFDGSSDKCKESLTAYGAFIPQSLLLEIRRPSKPGKQTAEMCFDELQDVAKKTESRTGTKFTKVVNDSCEQQTKVRKIWEVKTPWLAYGCSGHTTHNGSKYIWDIPFFRDSLREFTLVYGIKNTKAIGWVNPLILTNRLTFRMQLRHIKQEKKEKLQIRNNNNDNSNNNSKDNNIEKEMEKINKITIEQIKRKEIEFSDTLKQLFESEKFKELIASKLANSKERVGWFNPGETRKWNAMVRLCEHLLSIKDQLLEAYVYKVHFLRCLCYTTDQPSFFLFCSAFFVLFFLFCLVLID